MGQRLPVLNRLFPPRDPKTEVEVAQFLRSLGVPAQWGSEGVQPTEGSVLVQNPPSESVVLESSMREATSDSQLAANERPGPTAILQWLFDEHRAQRLLPCLERLPCWMQPGCCQTKTSWITPNIQWDVRPTEVKKARACLNVWPGCSGIEGEVVTKLINQSIEGVKVTTTACKCRGGPEGTKNEIVAGSADIDETGTQDAKLPENSNEFLARLATKFGVTKPNVQVQVVISFRKEGLFNLIKGIWQIWTRGSTDFDVHIESTVQYQWQGKTNSRKRVWDMRIRLPVRELSYSVNCCT